MLTLEQLLLHGERGVSCESRGVLEVTVLTHIHLEVPYVTGHILNLLLSATSLWNLYRLFTR